jgi:hypothetical protein
MSNKPIALSVLNDDPCRANSEPLWHWINISESVFEGHHLLAVSNDKDNTGYTVRMTRMKLQSLHTLLGEYLAQTEASGTGQQDNV